MARLESTRNGVGAVKDPETGDRLHIGSDVPTKAAERAANEYHFVQVVESDPIDEEYKCGVNDCSRSVDSPEEACWQHE